MSARPEADEANYLERRTVRTVDARSMRTSRLFDALPPYLGGKRRLAPLILADLAAELPPAEWPRASFCSSCVTAGDAKSAASNRTSRGSPHAVQRYGTASALCSMRHNARRRQAAAALIFAITGAASSGECSRPSQPVPERPSRGRGRHAAGRGPGGSAQPRPGRPIRARRSPRPRPAAAVPPALARRGAYWLVGHHRRSRRGPP